MSAVKIEDGLRLVESCQLMLELVRKQGERITALERQVDDLRARLSLDTRTRLR